MEPSRVAEPPEVERVVEVSVREIRPEARGVIAVEFVRSGGGLLPAFTAGSHIDVYLPNAIRRSYSLVNSQDERESYVIGVAKDPFSRGGSAYIHERLRPGDTLSIGAPRNNFPLAEAASRHVMIAGGIGITPFCSMIRRLNDLGRDWTLHYCARTREQAGFVDLIGDLSRQGKAEVHFIFDREDGAHPLDIASVVAGQKLESHIYCCGPRSMLEAFKTACTRRQSDRIHVEYFSSDAAVESGGGFTIVLARSHRRIAVPRGKTILAALLDEGVDVAFSCQEGVCGACETRVLAGVPEHRDCVLSTGEHETNRSMMICCSGALTPELVLDL